MYANFLTYNLLKSIIKIIDNMQNSQIKLLITMKFKFKIHNRIKLIYQHKISLLNVKVTTVPAPSSEVTVISMP